MELAPHGFRFHAKASLVNALGLRHDPQPVLLPIESMLDKCAFRAPNDEARLDGPNGKNMCTNDCREGMRGDGTLRVAKDDGELDKADP